MLGNNKIWIFFQIPLSITCIISITGGLTAIMYIDALQAVIMVIGAVVLCPYAFMEANIRSVSQFQSAFLNTSLDLEHLTGMNNFSEYYS